MSRSLLFSDRNEEPGTFFFVLVFVILFNKYKRIEGKGTTLQDKSSHRHITSPNKIHIDRHNTTQDNREKISFYQFHQ